MLQQYAEMHYPGSLVVGKSKSPWHYAVNLMTPKQGALTLWLVMPTQELDNRQRKGRLNALHLYQHQLESVIRHSGVAIAPLENTILMTSHTPSHTAAEMLEDKGFLPEFVFMQVLNALRIPFMRAPSRLMCGIDARWENFGVVHDRMVYTAVQTPRVRTKHSSLAGWPSDLRVEPNIERWRRFRAAGILNQLRLSLLWYAPHLEEYFVQTVRDYLGSNSVLRSACEEMRSTVDWIWAGRSRSEQLEIVRHLRYDQIDALSGIAARLTPNEHPRQYRSQMLALLDERSDPTKPEDDFLLRFEQARRRVLELI